MTLAVLSSEIVGDDRSAIRVTFDGAVTAASVESTDAWSVVVDGAGASVVVVSAALLDSGDAVDLVVHPEVSAGAEYTVTALTATNEGEDVPDPDSATLVVATSLAASPADEWPHGLLAVLVETLACAVNELDGTVATRLVRDLAPDDDVALVEGTLGFPSSGTVFLGARRASYTSTADGALLGFATLAPRAVTVPAGTAVVVVPSSVPPAESQAFLSQLERVRRTRLVHRAEGKQLAARARAFNLVRPGIVSEDAWRRALREAVWGPRETMGCIFAFLRELLDAWEVTVAVSLDPGNPQRMTAVDGTPFEASHVGRRVIIDDDVYCVASVDASGAWAELVGIATSQWSAADWSAATTATARILAFRLEEPNPAAGDAAASGAQSCFLRVRVWLPFTGAPPTFLLQDNETRPTGMPKGGFLLPSASVRGDQASGPAPIWLGHRATWGDLNLRAMLSTPNRVEVVSAL